MVNEKGELCNPMGWIVYGILYHEGTNTIFFAA